MDINDIFMFNVGKGEGRGLMFARKFKPCCSISQGQQLTSLKLTLKKKKPFYRI